MNRKRVVAALIIIISVLLMHDALTYRIKTGADVTLIPHAGAGLRAGPYANSLEALERGYSDGHRVFEVDVHLTRDGYPVLVHDWGVWFDKWFIDGGNIGAAPSKSQFFNLAMRHGQTQLDLATLAGWIAANPDIIVELNVKTDEQRVLAEFAIAYPLILNQIVAEVYDPADDQAVRALGYRKIVWVADAFTAKQILEVEAEHDFYAIALRYDASTLSVAKSITTPVGRTP